VSGAQTPRPV